MNICLRGGLSLSTAFLVKGRIENIAQKEEELRAGREKRTSNGGLESFKAQRPVAGTSSNES
jgi:hypothetical protein